MCCANLEVPWVVVKHLLRGLAVMNIPIDNKYLFNTLVVQSMLGSNRDIIIKTIAAIFTLHSVMSRRPYKKSISLKFKNKIKLYQMIPDNSHSILAFVIQD